MICFEAKRFFYNHSGLGQYERWLLNALQKTAMRDHYKVLKPGFQKSEFAHHFLPQDLIEYNNTFGINRSIFLENLLPNGSLLHGLSNELPLFSNSKIKARIVTLHDVIFRHRPMDYPWTDRQIYHLKTKNAVAKADAIIAISQWTKNDLIQLYGAKEEKIKVLYQDIDAVYDQLATIEQKKECIQKYGLPEEYAIVVSAFTPRKNHQILIDMISSITSSNRITIVLIGEGSEKVAFQKKINQLGLAKYFRFLKNINNATLAVLIQSARLMIFPSLMEGFGRPVLEAFASGVPVICHNEGAINEMASDAALQVDCRDPEQIATAVQQLNQDDHIRMNFMTLGFRRRRFFESNSIIEQYKYLYESFL